MSIYHLLVLGKDLGHNIASFSSFTGLVISKNARLLECTVSIKCTGLKIFEMILHAKKRDTIPVTNWQGNVDNNDGYGNLHIIVSGLVFERNGDLGTEFPAAKRINYGLLCSG